MNTNILTTTLRGSCRVWKQLSLSFSFLKNSERLKKINVLRQTRCWRRWSTQ